MAASSRPPRSPGRRPRRGSLERPVSGRMYRGTWLLVGLPLLVAAFSVVRAESLPPPTVPPSFDGATAAALAADLASRAPDRAPGTPGALRAVDWVGDRLELYGFQPQRRVFEAEIPGRGTVPLTNLFAVAAGPSPEAPVIVVMAHRDSTGLGRGANDNASGTAAMLEIARPYAPAPSGPFGAVSPSHTIVFLSTDGGAFGGIGAARFADDPAYGDRIVAVVNLDTISGPGSPRLEIAGDAPLSPAAPLVQTAADLLFEETGADPRHPHALWQLVDLGFPFSLYEQAPFVARRIPAVTVTAADARPPSSFRDSPTQLDEERIGQIGRAAQRLVSTLDEGLQPPPSAAAYLYVGPRLIRGWAVQLVLIAALLPFLAATVDLFARLRRRRIPLAPALRSYRSRLAFWIAAGGMFALFGVAGAWPDGAPRPISPDTAAAHAWPLLPLAGLGFLAFLVWLVPRERLLPRRPVHPAEELAGYTAALLALGVLSLVVVATNPYALVFLLPSLHVWLWLPQVWARPVWVRLVVLAAGLAGPALLVASFAARFELGLDALWYVVTLVTVGYVDPAAAVVVLAWAAAAAQLAALSVRRYAPYPDAAERPPRGPFRELVRRAAVALRDRRGETEGEVRALQG